MHQKRKALLKSLKTKHKNLDKEIDQLYKHTSAELSLKQLKKQKLSLKEKITKLETELGDHNGKEN